MKEQKSDLKKKRLSGLREGKEKNSRLDFHPFSHDSLECQHKGEVHYALEACQFGVDNW